MKDSNPLAFISYSWDNGAIKSWVKRLACDLQQNGIEVFLDANDMTLGDRIETKVSNAIERSDFVLIILTPSYKDKMKKRGNWVQREYQFYEGFTKYKGKEIKLIPILKSGTEKTSIPDELQSHAWIDMTSNDEYIIRFKELIATVFPDLKTPKTHGVKPSSLDNIRFESEAEIPGHFIYQVEYLRKSTATILITHGETGTGKTVAITRFCRYLIDKGDSVEIDLKPNTQKEYHNYLSECKKALELPNGLISTPSGEFPLVIDWELRQGKKHTIVDVPGSHYNMQMAGKTETSYLDIIFNLSNKRINLLFLDYQTAAVDLDHIHELSKFIETNFKKGVDHAIIIISKADLSQHLTSSGSPVTPRFVREFEQTKHFRPLLKSLKTKGIDSPAILPYSSMIVEDLSAKTQAQSLDYFPKKLWNAIIKSDNWSILDLLKR